MDCYRVTYIIFNAVYGEAARRVMVFYADDVADLAEQIMEYEEDFPEDTIVIKKNIIRIPCE